MAAFVLTFPVITLRSIIVVSEDLDKTIARVVDGGAAATDKCVQTNATHGFYVDPKEGFQVSYREIDTVAEPEEDIKIPPGTVMQ